MNAAALGADQTALVVSCPAYRNWRESGPTPLLLNPQADMHALIAWCWGEVSRVTDSLLLNILAGTGTIDGSIVADVAYQQLLPVAEVLPHMGDVSFQGGDRRSITSLRGEA